MTLAKAWIPITKPIDIKRLAKLGEELGELTKIVSRIMQQGLDGVDPKSWIINVDALTDEIADVEANLTLVIKHFKLDQQLILQRSQRKISEQEFWGNDV